MNCSIPNFQQCVADILPFNGYCWRNPNYRGNQRAPRRSKEIGTRNSRFN